MKAQDMLCTVVLVFAISMGFSSGAAAGSQANAKPRFEPRAIADFSKKVEKQLAARGVRVAIISRLGQSQADLPPGIRYTHTAFAVYSTIKTADGRVVPGYAIYNLYQRTGEAGASDLVIDYPLDFFMGAHELRTGIVIPTAELQRRLLQVIASETYKSLHNSRYSMISNPFDTSFQNCTEFTLDVLNAAIYDTSDRRQIKVNTRAHFKAHTVEVSPFKLMMGSMLEPGIAMSDHDGPVQTSTFTTISRYLEDNRLVGEKFEITAP